MGSVYRNFVVEQTKRFNVLKKLLGIKGKSAFSAFPKRFKLKDMRLRSGRKNHSLQLKLREFKAIVATTFLQYKTFDLPANGNGWFHRLNDDGQLERRYKKEPWCKCFSSTYYDEHDEPLQAILRDINTSDDPRVSMVIFKEAMKAQIESNAVDKLKKKTFINSLKGRNLTPRERTVYMLIRRPKERKKGLRFRTIALRLKLSISAVKTYFSRACKKLK